MKRTIVVAVAAMILPALLATPASANWTAPGSGVTVGDGSTLNGGAPPKAARPVARPAAGSSSSAPARAPSVKGKLIEISKAIPQTLTAWENGRVVMRFKISTGKPGYRTPSGRFKVRAKGLAWWSRKWKVVMPYAMNFFQNYNLHSLPHARGSRKLIGASTLGRPASHGCIRIGPADAKRLYSWAPVGTPVWIH